MILQSNLSPTLRRVCLAAVFVASAWMQAYSQDENSFRMEITPTSFSGYALAADTAEYQVTVKNLGTLADSYNLSAAGNAWPTFFFNAAGTKKIKQTATIQPGAQVRIHLRVAVPTGTAADRKDEAKIRIVSMGNAIISTTAKVVTRTPGQLPWSETFASTTLDPVKWPRNTGPAAVNMEGMAETSAPYSLNLDGDERGADEIHTQPINLSGMSNVKLEYYYQRTGAGNSPEDGDDLWVGYLNSAKQWVNLKQYFGAGADMTTFTKETIILPADAHHAFFQLRFRNKATPIGPNDDWFIDDIKLSLPPDIAITPDSLSAAGAWPSSASRKLTIRNDGHHNLDFQISSRRKVDPSFSRTPRTPAELPFPIMAREQIEASPASTQNGILDANWDGFADEQSSAAVLASVSSGDAISILKIGIIQTGDYFEVRDRLAGLGYHHTSFIPPTSGLAQLKNFEIIYLPSGWADGVVGSYSTLQARAADYRAYVKGGGGLFVDQPNPYQQPGAQATPSLLPYPITFYNIYDTRDWPPVIVNPNHEITKGLQPNEMPFPADRIIANAPEYEILVRGAFTSNPSLVVATHGRGRVLVQTAHPTSLHAAVYVRMVEWVGKKSIAWLSYTPNAGTVAPGSRLDIAVQFSSAPAFPGFTYDAELVISANDPDEAAVTVPVQMIVNPEPYFVAVDPAASNAEGYGKDVVKYTLHLRNYGQKDDSYNLASTGNKWKTKFFDSTGTKLMSRTPIIAAGGNLKILVKVTIDSLATKGMQDTARVTATSVGNPGRSSAARLTTISRGLRVRIVSLPFTDNFSSLDLDSLKWLDNLGPAAINELGANEPSPPSSLNLNGADNVRSQPIDLFGKTGVLIRYAYQSGGAGNAPENGNNLLLDYLDNTGKWINLKRHLGNGARMNFYASEELILPAGAYHQNFAIRFRTNGDVYDDWFVDDISLFLPPEMAVTSAPDPFNFILNLGDSSAGAITIKNTGGGELKFFIADQASPQLPNWEKRNQLEALIEKYQSVTTPPAGFDSFRNAENEGIGAKLPAQNAGNMSSIKFAESPSSALPNVVLLYCEIYPHYFTDVRDKLLATGKFSSIAAVDLGFVTPTLPELRLFDGALIFGGTGHYANKLALSNVLADYVDAGGGLVTGLFVTGSSLQTWVLNGRFRSGGYYAIEPGSQIQGMRRFLGFVHAPDHPIMQGIKSFDGGSSSFQTTGTLAAGAQRIADWSDRKILVATKMINGHRRVDLGFYPSSNDARSDFWNSKTDGVKLLVNALLWAMGNDEKSWLSYSPSTGTVAPNDSATINVKVRTKNLLPNRSEKRAILISSNDPDEANVLIPAALSTNPVPYFVVIDPNASKAEGFAKNAVTHALRIYNHGQNSDSYKLTKAGNKWKTQFFDSTGTTLITTTPNVAAGGNLKILAKVTVDSLAVKGAQDTVRVIATSVGNPGRSSAAKLTTTSRGLRLRITSLPFTDNFSDSTLDALKWFDNSGPALVNTRGANEPSPPYSLNLNGKDNVRSQDIDLSRKAGIQLRYAYEMGGEGDPAESGNDLWVDYLNSEGNWINLKRHFAVGAKMSSYTFAELILPPDAYHRSFAIRFRATGEANTDDWFVDDISIAPPPEIAVAPGNFAVALNWGNTAAKTMQISNSGQSDLNFSLFIAAASDSTIPSKIDETRHAEYLNKISPHGFRKDATSSAPIINPNYSDGVTPTAPAPDEAQEALGLANPAVRPASVCWNYSHSVIHGVMGYLMTEIRKAGHTIIEMNKPITAAALADYDVLVIETPRAAALSADEIAAAQAFVNSGHGLFVIGEAEGYLLANGINSLNALLSPYGMSLSDSFNPGIDTPVTDFTAHPVTQSIRAAEFIYFSNIAVKAPSVKLARTNTGVTVLAAYRAAGKIVLASDSNPFDNTRLYKSDNLLLSLNIFDWLSSPPSLSWLTATPTSSTVAPGGAASINLSFNTRPVLPGKTYRAKVIINSNDPDESPFTTPAQLTVNPESYFALFDPDSSKAEGYGKDVVKHELRLFNYGQNDDSYNLSAIGNNWKTKFFDSTGTKPITRTPTVVAGGNLKILAKVTIDSLAVKGMQDTARVIATSVGNPARSATAKLTTTSRGIRIRITSLPFTDNFSNLTLDSLKWLDNLGPAVINTLGANEPSPPYALNLNGADNVRSQAIDLSGKSGVLIRYAYEMGGDGDAPESGKNLLLDYLDNAGKWINLKRHLGGGVKMTSFIFEESVLPASAYHKNFAIRFRATGKANADDWFVDNVSIVLPPVISIAPNLFEVKLSKGDSTTQTLTIENRGPSDLNYSISVKPRSAAPSRQSFTEAVRQAENIGPLSQSQLGGDYAVTIALPQAASANTAAKLRILTWTGYADLAREYPNTLAALRKFYTDFALIETAIQTPAELQTFLNAAAVFLIPEQETGLDLASLGASWAAVLNPFVASGGTVIVLDHGPPSVRGSLTLLNGTGLMNLTIQSDFTNNVNVRVVDAAHPLTAGLPISFIAMNGNNTHVSNGVKVIENVSSGGAVVSARVIGSGRVIYIGMDFFEYNFNMARLLANAVQWQGSRVDWLALLSPSSNTVAPGAAQNVSLQFNAKKLPADTTVNADIVVSSNDPSNPTVIIPASLRTASALGATSPAAQMIHLRQGWNRIPYFPDAPLAPQVALRSIIANLNIVKEDSGRFMIPELADNMKRMRAGRSYKVNLRAPDTLIYPNASTALTKEAIRPLAGASVPAKHFKPVSMTGESYSLVVTSIKIDGREAKTGDEIAVFTAEGRCAGAGVWNESGLLTLTAWRDDERTPEIDGYRPGETMSFHWWSRSAHAEVKLTPVFERGDGAFENGPYALVKLSAQTLPKAFALQDAYPNPLRRGGNPEIIIAFDLPRESRVTIKIFTVMGEEVRTLVEGPRPAGYHKVVWDGRNSRREFVTSGVYLYRLQAADFAQTKRVTVLK